MHVLTIHVPQSVAYLFKPTDQHQRHGVVEGGVGNYLRSSDMALIIHGMENEHLSVLGKTESTLSRSIKYFKLSVLLSLSR